MKWIKFEGIVIVIVVRHDCSYGISVYSMCIKIIGQMKGDGKRSGKDECKGMDSSRMEFMGNV